MKLTILGCGTSTGVPVVGCRCKVCLSADPRNKRTRSSLLVNTAGMNILIDTSTDLRAQALRTGLDRVDHVLFTHPHADHVNGIDDLRAFNMAQKRAIPCYGNALTMARLAKVFDYIFDNTSAESWRPDLRANVVGPEPFDLGGVTVTPIEVVHGKARILGYRIGKAAYLTDVSEVPEGSMEKLAGLDVLVIGALRRQKHPTHLSIDEAVAVAARLKPGRALFTHLSHNIDYAEDNATLPPGVELAHDGMELEAGE